VSAIDQFCEVIPTATGGQNPWTRSTPLGSQLPRGIVTEAENLPAWQLLTIPAAHPRPARPAPLPGRHGPSDASADPWSLMPALVLLLLAIALAGVATAAMRARRRPRSA